MYRLSSLEFSRSRLALVLTALVLGAASGATAQPSGMVTWSGPGAELLPSPTFVPAAYAGEESSWGFFDESGNVGVVVIELAGNPTLASLVSVSVEGGASWIAIGFTGVPGVSIGGGTIQFRDVTIAQSGVAAPADLTLNGSLTRDPLPVSTMTWGRVKRLYSGSGR